MSQFFILLFLIILNGFFVASEIVLIAIRKTKVDEMLRQKTPAARLIKEATDNLDKYISATQLGITIISLLLGWIGEAAVADKLITTFNFFPRGPLNLLFQALTVVITFLFITYLQIVIGELVPKGLALKKTEFIIMLIIGPLTAFTKLFHPFVSFLNQSANFVLRVLGIEPSKEDRLGFTKEEIRAIFEQFRETGAYPKDEIEMAENVFRLSDIPINQIMIPRTDIVAFEETATFESVVKQIDGRGFSRYPVYSRTIDNIIGFIHVKDIYRAVAKMGGKQKLSQTNLIRKIIGVPESKKADEVLLDMRKNHIHLAVAEDEYGGTAGIVSLEDIIESLVGEIQDEFDTPIKEIRRQIDGSFVIDGRASLEAVQKRFRFPVKGLGYTTIGGLVFGLLGREPKVGDNIQLGNVTFAVEEIEGKRIKSIKLRRESYNR